MTGARERQAVPALGCGVPCWGDEKRCIPTDDWIWSSFIFPGDLGYDRTFSSPAGPGLPWFLTQTATGRSWSLRELRNPARTYTTLSPSQPWTCLRTYHVSREPFPWSLKWLKWVPASRITLLTPLPSIFQQVFSNTHICLACSPDQKQLPIKCSEDSSG